MISRFLEDNNLTHVALIMPCYLFLVTVPVFTKLCFSVSLCNYASN